MSQSPNIGRPHLVHETKDREDVGGVYASGFVIPVLQHTSDLLTILEWADRAAINEHSPNYGEHGHAPAGMSVAMFSQPLDREYSSFSEAGSEGAVVQLAYKSWVALVAGLWERFRKATSLHKKDGPKHGLQTAVFGDLQKIRNDVLKNNGIAKNSTSCEILKWFAVGETIQFKLDHVLEFLHHMGHPLRSYMLLRNDQPSHHVGWRMALPMRSLDLLRARRPPWRLVSFILMVEEVPKGSGSYTLGISLMFADGVSGGFYIERSADRDRLVSRKQAIEEAPRDDLGAPIVDGTRTDVRVTYEHAKQSLENGQLPTDPCSPPMQFGRPEQETSANAVD